MGSIIVGIGGVGKTVLMKLRRQIVEEQGQFDGNISDVFFLHVDTYDLLGQEAGQEFETKVLNIDISLRDEERIILSESLTSNEIKLLINDKYVQYWFPKGLPKENINLSVGAGGIRAYGRLAFHDKAGVFINKLEALVERATENSNKVDIYFVCSFFGGTGSGAIMDACYLSKKVRKGHSGENHGFFIIGGVPSGKTDYINNSYATLMELEYYMTGRLVGGINTPFTIDFPANKINKLVSKEAPLDTCYLFDTFNGYTTKKRTELEELVAKRIFLEIMPGVREPIIGKRIDIQEKPEYMIVDSLQKRAKTFFATGVSVIEFPAHRLQNLCGSMLTAHFCNNLLYLNAPGFSDVTLRTNYFIESCFDISLVPELLIKELEKEDKGRTIHNSAKENINEWYKFLIKIINGDDSGDIETHARKSYTEATDSIGTGATYEKIIDSNMDRIWQNNEIHISNLIEKYVTDPLIGPQHALKFIDELTKRLESLRDRCSFNESTLRRTHDKVELKLRHINNDKKYNWELKKHIHWYCNRELLHYLNQGIDKIIHNKLRVIYDKIKIRLDSEKKKVQNYIDILNEIKSKRLEESKEICENIIKWVTIESQNKKYMHLEHLQEFLLEFKNHSKNNNILGKFYDIFSQLIKNYDISNPCEDTEKVIQELALRFIPYIQTDMLSNPEKFNKDLFKTTRDIFSPIRKVNICELIGNIDDDSREKLLSDKRKESNWYLQIFTTDETINHKSDIHEIRYAIVPEGVPINSHRIWSRTLSDINQGHRTDSIKEPYRMVLLSEISVFCLRSINFIRDEYSQIYKELSEENKKIIHTNESIDFPDIIPESDDIRKISDRAVFAELFGKIFEFLKESEIPDGDGDKAIYLHYSDSTVGKKVNLLCNRWDEVQSYLTKQQAEKEIHHSFKNSKTDLELLEEEIDKRASEARKKKEKKEELCNMLQNHLSVFLNQMPGLNDEERSLNNAYQIRLDFIGTFLKKYRLEC
ncbi:MAG: hypothetical protein GY793_11600 [Proteobacteria bacterium]|nr:hypothetical protein [Pseudomonadota bacterium]